MREADERHYAMTNQPGTYALVLACQNTSTLRIGGLGDLALQPGVYVYVGSAFGPGGLSARIKHHGQIAARPHWHIDYLRAICDLAEVWYTTSAGRHEHSWGKAVAQMAGATVPMPGFGSSDCACEAHLFWFKHPPSIRTFRRLVQTKVNARP
jgi:Uri superfamily endonuclease